MEDILAPLLAVLIMIGSSILGRISKQKKGESPPQQNKTLMDYGRELIKQIEQLDKGTLFPESTVSKSEQAETMQRINDPTDSFERNSQVNMKQEYTRSIQRSEKIERVIDRQTAPLQVERKSPKGFPINKRLSKKDLRQSIVMAEILGPPRAKQPHSPIKR
ncbi:hypothetical protein [Alkalibacter mobilis]|uniref:hypothetical protein n=1 Tax=Alkalibacter mobilis TaxID=2787712 RepID=UPI00189D2E82|nr:hypothetical protein [Alkalibacter mobilis]MBF7096733.1 hypothetical protein [Alkalibacter mobilis]